MMHHVRACQCHGARHGAHVRRNDRHACVEGCRARRCDGPGSRYSASEVHDGKMHHMRACQCHSACHGVHVRRSGRRVCIESCRARRRDGPGGRYHAGEVRGGGGSLCQGVRRRRRRRPHFLPHHLGPEDRGCCQSGGRA